MSKYVFLDRDNTLTHDDGYLHQPELVRLLPGVAAGLRLLSANGFKFIIITNQSGIGRGLFSEAEMHATNDKLIAILAAENITIERVYFCPHRPEEGCSCRKPKDELLKRASKDFSITPDEFKNSYFIGDKTSDAQAGAELGVKGILLHKDKKIKAAGLCFVGENFRQATTYILEDEFENGWQKKIISQAEQGQIQKQIGDSRLVFTNGCFDLLHPGHIQYLYQARQLGDKLVVALNDDKSVQSIKGPERPINTLHDRMLLLANLPFVDYITYFGEDTPIKTLKRIKPDIHVKGGDYKIESLPEYETVRDYGGQVIILPFRAGYSSTRIIEKLSKK